MSLPLDVEGLSVFYRQPDGAQTAILTEVNLTLPPGASLGIHGPSGSGKSTLLNALSGLSPATGTIRWGDVNLQSLSEPERDAWRLRHASFIFQDIHLFSGLSVLENVLFPLTLQQWRIKPEQRLMGEGLLDHFEVSVHRKVSVLSRGELQRVAAARALINQPQVLFADEPTASLDVKHARALSEKLKDYCLTHQVSFVAVSHDSELLRQMEHRVLLERGRLQAKELPEE